MVNNAIRDELPSGAIVFDDYAFDNSIIGITDDDRVIYSYSKMIDELAEETKWLYEDVVEWIDYNTIRGLNYFADENKPIICYEVIV